MTARTRSPLGPSGGRRAGAHLDDEPGAVGRLGWVAAPTRLRVALLLATAGSVVTFVAVRAGLVAGQPLPAFGSSALLLVLAVAPAVLAWGFLLAGRAPYAAGVLGGAALLAPGLALVDLQFVFDALRAARPEMMVATSLAPLAPAAGAWLLLVGHLVVFGAGLLAGGRAGAGESSDYYAALDRTVSTAARGRAMGWALTFATVSVVGLFLPPFQSDNAFLVAHDLVGSPSLVKYGGLLIAGTVLLGGVVAAGRPRPDIAQGMVVGLLAALSWLVVPQIAAIAAVDWLRLDRGGPLIALVPLVLLVVVQHLVPGLRRADRAERGEGELPPDLRLDSSPLHLVTGVLGVLTGIAALGGAIGTLVVVDGGEQIESYANRQLVPAGIVVIVLGAALFTRWAGLARPAFVVSLGAVALVGFAALDAAFTGTSGPVLSVPVVTADVRVGAGAWFTGVALVLAVAAAVAGAVAGGAERDDVDLTERTLHTRIAIPLGAAVLFAVGAFGSPMITAPDFTAPGIWTEFRLASWGLLVGLAVVVAAAVIAAMARPQRAVALLLGAAALVGVHLFELPLTGDRTDSAQAGSGTWLSLACLLALLVAAALAATDRTGPVRDLTDAGRKA